MKDERLMVNGQWWRRVQWTAFVCCLVLCAMQSTAQQISTILSKDKIVIGEQVTLRIAVEGIRSDEVLQDFKFPDTINHIEILSDSIDADGPSFVHTLTLTSFDSGYWQFPSFELVLADNRRLVSQPVDLTVMPVDVSNLADYHDIKDILDVPAENNWWLVAAIVLTALISMFAFLWFVTNKTTVQPTTTAGTDLGVLYSALQKRLSELENNSTAGNTDTVSLYNETSQRVRVFVDTALGEQTSHLTSGEYMLRIKGRLSDAEAENSYFQFLRLADAVKFARYQPPAAETNSIFPALRNVVELVYHQNKSLQ